MPHDRALLAYLDARSKPDRRTGCLIWTGSIQSNGYGHCRRYNRLDTVHRWQWLAAKGPIPAGLNVLHTCDNRPCRRQRHLFLGTQRENMWDAIGKGRHLGGGKPRGDCKQMATVTPEVLKLIKRRNDLRISQRDLDKMVGVSECMIAKWESGNRHPTANSLSRWAAALGLRVELVPNRATKKEKVS